MTDTPRTSHDEEVKYVEADDGLPTAMMEVNGAQRRVKLDSCARFTVAGTDWMAHGDKLNVRALVDYVEGIGSFSLEVVGVWRFQLRTVFNEVIKVDACIVSGCADDVLLGVDFMRARGATMDSHRNEVRYADGERTMVVPFRSHHSASGARIVAVRMVSRSRLMGHAVTPVEVSMASEDGERGLFLPTEHTAAVLLAATVTTAQNGRAWVPAIDTSVAAAKIPNKKELGRWVSVNEDMEVLKMGGELDVTRVSQWIDELGDSVTPLDDEKEIHVGADNDDARESITKLLRVYPKLTVNTSECPPATSLDLYHHIDTGDSAPIMLKRRRQSRTEDQVIEENRNKILQSGVIEEGCGAWGFLVVLVHKKDGELDFVWTIVH
ncbi:unnamed protein product [Phytophthora fragariaefolia]|uniref:Unnamed protein product n=1 Tax=Phytophthora fragariaefolia TaxID=1490495 RepID=A0A9W6YM83_9STRA|nr:unnamed protein product [Phytophthora fragariaefolia]